MFITYTPNAVPHIFYLASQLDRSVSLLKRVLPPLSSLTVNPSGDYQLSTNHRAHFAFSPIIFTCSLIVSVSNHRDSVDGIARKTRQTAAHVSALISIPFPLWESQEKKSEGRSETRAINVCVFHPPSPPNPESFYLSDLRDMLIIQRSRYLWSNERARRFERRDRMTRRSYRQFPGESCNRIGWFLLSFRGLKFAPGHPAGQLQKQKTWRGMPLVAKASANFRWSPGQRCVGWPVVVSLVHRKLSIVARRVYERPS